MCGKITFLLSEHFIESAECRILGKLLSAIASSLMYIPHEWFRCHGDCMSRATVHATDTKSPTLQKWIVIKSHQLQICWSYCHYCIYGASEAVVVYPISVLDVHVIDPFLTHPTLKFGIHSQVTFWSTPFLYSCVAEGDTLPKLMDGKHMISTFMSAEKDVSILSSHSTYALCNCSNQVAICVKTTIHFLQWCTCMIC